MYRYIAGGPFDDARVRLDAPELDDPFVMTVPLPDMFNVPVPNVTANLMALMLRQGAYIYSTSYRPEGEEYIPVQRKTPLGCPLAGVPTGPGVGSTVALENGGFVSVALFQDSGRAVGL